MQIKSPSILFIILWKVASALENPKYITFASKRPHLVINAVFHLFSSLIQILLYPYLKLILVKIEALLSYSRNWIVIFDSNCIKSSIVYNHHDGDTMMYMG